MNLDYWNKYYTDSQNAKPSRFASFCLGYMDNSGSVMDLGCGAGQDSVFFASNGITVRGIDQSKTAIDICKKHTDGKLLSFTELSFLDIDKLHDQAKYMYLRFVLHAISQKEQQLLLPWVQSHIAKGGKIFIETRSVRDTRVPYADHTRRFISKRLLETELKNMGFGIIYSKEARNFSPIENEDPLLIRIVGVKK